MNTTRFPKCLLPGRRLIAALLVPVLATSAAALDVYLVARPFDMTMPDGRVVPTWGYALDVDRDLDTIGTEQASSPGPVITLEPTDTTLTIHLRNDLPEATSLVIPGQTVALDPVFFTDSSGRQRVRSFQPETQPGGIRSYSWPAVSEGTYLYQSGTHPAVQVQMGLFGALVQDYALGQAYSYGASRYDHEAVLVFSEVDPDLHDAVDAGQYGSPPWESTIGYRPEYFLVNGLSYPQTPEMPVGAPKDLVLLRMINAGQDSRSMALRNGIFGVVGEQGRRRPNVEFRAAVPLPAGSTRDVMTIVSTPGRIPLYDRTLALSNSDDGPGGMLVFLMASLDGSSSLLKNLISYEERVDTLYEKIGKLQLQQQEPSSSKKQASVDKKIAKLEAKIAKWMTRIQEVSEALGLKTLPGLPSP